METKHEPKPWDLYRTQDGVYYLIIEVSQASGYVGYLDMDDEGIDWMPPDHMEGDEFIGNVLALPDLMQALASIIDGAIPVEIADAEEVGESARAEIDHRELAAAQAALTKAGRQL